MDVVLNLLFASPIGLLSLFTILFMIGMAIYLVRMYKRKMNDPDEYSRARRGARLDAAPDPHSWGGRIVTGCHRGQPVRSSDNMYYDMSIFNTAITFSFEATEPGRRTETRSLL